jgi:hypothetical protein
MELIPFSTRYASPWLSETQGVARLVRTFIRLIFHGNMLFIGELDCPFAQCFTVCCPNSPPLTEKNLGPFSRPLHCKSKTRPSGSDSWICNRSASLRMVSQNSLTFLRGTRPTARKHIFLAIRAQSSFFRSHRDLPIWIRHFALTFEILSSTWNPKPQASGSLSPSVRLSPRRSLLTPDGFPTSPADFAHGQPCSPKVRELRHKSP